MDSENAKKMRMKTELEQALHERMKQSQGCLA